MIYYGNFLCYDMNMKTKFIIFFLFLSFILTLCFTIYRIKYITVQEFLHTKNENRWNELYLDKNNNIKYKNKIILKSNLTPLNRNNAYDYIEFDILFAAEKIKPNNGCNPSNQSLNGRMGCYLDFPNEK